MKVYENERVADWAIARIQKKFSDRGEDALHASEVFGCLRKAVLGRTKPKPYSRESIIQFAVGFAMQEWFLGPEEDGDEVNGIIFSKDSFVNDMPLEFKTTRKSYEVYQKDEKNKLLKDLPKVRFDPTDNDGWITRTRAYCAHAHNGAGVHTAHIIVFFLYANVMSAWTLEFTDEELEESRQDAIAKRDVIETHLEKGTLPPVTTRTWEGECEYCVHKEKECLEALVEAGLA